MKRLSIVFVLIVLGVVRRSAAYDDPHYKANNVQCLGCHSIHKAAGQNLTTAISNESLCTSCHNFGGTASRFPAESLMKADSATRTGSSHPWNVPATTTPSNANLAAALQRATSIVTCSVCHNQHGNVAAAVASGSAGAQFRATPVRIAGTGTGTVTFTAASDAVAKAYLLEIIEIGGNAGTAKFRLSNDGGISWFGWSGAAWVAYAAGNARLTGASIVLNDGTKVDVTFSGNFVIGDRIRFHVAYPFLRAPLDQGDNAAASKFCRDCHADRVMDHNGVNTWDGGMKSHPVGVVLNANLAGYDYPTPRDANGAAQGGAGADANATNDLVLDQGGMVQCLSCHGVHHADSNSETVDTP